MGPSARMRSISASSIRNYLTCREAYRIQDVDGWRSVHETPEQSIGKVLHAGLEPFWQRDGRGSDSMLESALRHPDASRLDGYGLALVEALLVGYDLYWDPTHAYGPAKTERRFGQTQDGYYFSGILDATVGDDTLVEHKTTSQDITPGGLYWAKLVADFQVGIYFEAASAVGMRPERMVYDVIRSPMVEPRRATPEVDRKYTKATKIEPSRLYANQRETDEPVEEYTARVLAKICENPSSHYVRQEIVRLDHERRRATCELDLLARDMLRVLPNEPQPRTGVATGACVRCDFQSPCLFGTPLDGPNFVRKARR